MEERKTVKDIIDEMRKELREEKSTDLELFMPATMRAHRKKAHVKKMPKPAKKAKKPKKTKKKGNAKSTAKKIKKPKKKKKNKKS
jgi:hypothetical protein